MRPETGPMKFGDDWTGVFIRGDNAGYYAMLLREALPQIEHPISRGMLEGLLKTLEGSNEHTTLIEPQRLKEFSECKLDENSNK